MQRWAGVRADGHQSVTLAARCWRCSAANQISLLQTWNSINLVAPVRTAWVSGKGWAISAMVMLGLLLLAVLRGERDTT